MARDPSIFSASAPVVVPTNVTIGHVQLRDLIICPHERGVVNYVQEKSILELDVTSRDPQPRVVSDLTFTPNTLSSLPICHSDHTLLAAGGQDSEIHLSLHAPRHDDSARRSKTLWRFDSELTASINNSVLLTSLSLAKSHETALEPRIGISNNDCTVKFFDIPIRGDSPPKTLNDAGTLRLDVPVNHSSISPDGRTLLSVGDSSEVHLHRLSGGSRITFSPITTLMVPPPDTASPLQPFSPLAASFSTAFSSNGSKFAVASQEGVVVVWDVRSTKPLKVFRTDTTRATGKGPRGIGGASGWLSDDPWEWTRGGSKAPGWGVRSVKFNSGGCGGYPGRELMTFTEHTSFLHVIDARTFETEEIVRVPSPCGRPHPPSSPMRRSRVPSISPSRIPPPTTVAGPSTRSPVGQPPPPRIILELEETFRVPSSSPRHSEGSRPMGTSRMRSVRHGRRSLHNGYDMDDDDESFVVIPSLGDREVENDVRLLLGRHGIRTRHADEDGDREMYDVEDGYASIVRPGDDDVDIEMEVDELESDCVSSHTPSRSASPVPSASPRLAPLHRLTRTRRTRSRGQLDGGRDCPSGIAEQELDLAGTCFDPTGGFVYVASVEGIAEWRVRGADKRWWAGSEWV